MHKFSSEDIKKIQHTIKTVGVMNKEHIPFGKGKPKRDTVIKTDDVVNLVIALNTAKSMEEFLMIV